MQLTNRTVPLVHHFVEVDFKHLIGFQDAKCENNLIVEIIQGTEIKQLKVVDIFK